MFNFVKKFFIFFMIFTVFTSFIFANRKKTLEKNFFYKIKVEHNKKKSTSIIFLLNNEKYINLKQIAKFYHADIEYKQISREIFLKFKTKNNIKIINIKLGSINAYLDNKKIVLERIPFIYGSKVFIPLSVLLRNDFNEFLGSYTVWNENESILKIKTEKFLKKHNLALKDIEEKKEKKIQNENINPNTINKENIANINFDENINPNTINKENIANINFDENIHSNKNTNLIEMNNLDAKLNKENVYSIDKDINNFINQKLKETENIQNINISENLELNKKNIKKINKIIVDPGHGGKDPGANYFGIYEKNITLDISKKLKNILEKEYEKIVFLTRDTDNFISLQDRTKKANNIDGDLFISVHINASSNKKDKNGFEIYYLSDKASDKEAEIVAKRENIYFDTNENKLNHILWSMKINEYVNESSKFSHFIDKNITSELKEIKNNGIKQAGFFVLKGVKMPAVLLEIGYLSNKKEMSYLLNQNIQKNIATLIAKSIIDYEDSI